MKTIAKYGLLIALGVSVTVYADADNKAGKTKENIPAAISAVKAYEAKVMIPLAGVQAPEVFVRLQNTGDKPVSLVKATTAMAEQVVIMQPLAGKAKESKAQSSLVLPAKTLVDLHKGGSYLLLKGLKAQLQTGDQVHVQLHFSDNTQVEFVAIAKSAFDQPHHH